MIFKDLHYKLFCGQHDAKYFYIDGNTIYGMFLNFSLNYAGLQEMEIDNPNQQPDRYRSAFLRGGDLPETFWEMERDEQLNYLMRYVEG